MRFLIDANLPRSTAKKVADYGHDAIDVRDIGLAAATNDAIAAHARNKDLVVL